MYAYEWLTIHEQGTAVITNVILAYDALVRRTYASSQHFLLSLDNHSRKTISYLSELLTDPYGNPLSAILRMRATFEVDKRLLLERANI
ncbi:hypothetical protein GCM10009000_065230 [Halobacterium noricense]|uniref:Transposase n=1 Tax=Haladaptatus pallidirubidus TaxID=1008152 RepID=A0AAV3UHV4_9EURY